MPSMTLVVATHEVIHVKGNVEVSKVVFVQFLFVVNCRPFSYDFSAEITNCPISFDDSLACFLPQFRLVDFLMLVHLLSPVAHTNCEAVSQAVRHLQ